MAKYKVRTYLSTYVDVEVETKNADEAIEMAKTNRNLWFNDNQILEHVEVEQGKFEIISVEENNTKGKIVYVFENVWENGNEFEGGVNVRVFSNKEEAIISLKSMKNSVMDALSLHYDDNDIVVHEGSTYFEVQADDYTDCWTGSVYCHVIE